ncbi:hypothetical protein GGI04_003383 [Coemansia thaxteri]|uniref:Protein kinase domain-containing protein n=1 Tax=Coemansia thaxteri TaxID=2663907 RepID=A0A9W8BI80_9FUNG|nr:hypothetical protein GGI04_003383 [Coemansia thaxteri]KAJ2008632.1 hypothetical protein H4R26_000113 [Coemansia thaxteri]KAJ2466220.1 hypothetical protein GGI02_004441 [Coemansia sp. RSA 2322]KAJ2488122.1 hypothetical protein EV174_000082 [Coemansia sp. RSA 2320]
MNRLAAAGGEQQGPAGLAQLDIERCMAVSSGRSRAGLASLSSSDTLMSFCEEEGVAMELRVDRSKVVGKGQYSTVCFATLERVGGKKRAGSVPCVLKIPHAGNLDARELGLIEAAALAQVGGAAAVVECFGLVNLRDADSHGVCPVRSWAEAGAQAVGGSGEWALVLEYCERGPCWEWMTANKAAMDAELFFLWARQLALALIALQSAGVAHSDIKGHNMLLDRSGDIRLADFTAAQFSPQALAAIKETCAELDPASYPAYTDFSGTIPYSAPEMLTPAASKAPGATDPHKADIYSLGVSLYTLFVSGQEPYATVKSSVEQMLLAAKGAFWEWEERHCLASLPHRLPCSTAPTTPLDGPTRRSTQPPSPVTAAATLAHAGLSRSLSLTLGGPSRPLRRRRTLKSRTAAPREFRTFLSGDPLPPNVEALLQSMVSPDPRLRPDAAEILRMLDSMEADVFEA